MYLLESNDYDIVNINKVISLSSMYVDLILARLGNADREPPDVGTVIVLHAHALAEPAARRAVTVGRTPGERTLAFDSRQSHRSEQPLTFAEQEDALCHFAGL